MIKILKIYNTCLRGQNENIVNVYIMTFSQERNCKLSFILFTSKSYFKCYCMLYMSGQIITSNDLVVFLFLLTAFCR